MLANYIKIALRNLSRRRGYALINITGLTVGITCCLLIFQYVSWERSFDDFPDNADRIVRLRLDSYQQGELAWKSATVYPAFGPTMKKDFPEVEEFCRLYDANLLLSNEEKDIKFTEDKGYFADPAFLKMFSVQFIKGDPNTALNEPYHIVLSESMAKKYFGEEDPIGKKLVSRDADRNRTLEVSGVFKDLPANSHLIVPLLISYNTLTALVQESGNTSNPTETSWGWYDFYTYLLLRPHTDVAALEAKFPDFCDRHINNNEWRQANNVTADVHLIPLTDIHLYSNSNQEAEVNGNGQAVSFLFLIAFLIIAIAWINYVNLATSRSLERAREVGVRKVAGAERQQLILQFMTESFMMNFIALLLGLITMRLISPWFVQFTGIGSGKNVMFNPDYWNWFILMFLAGSIISGIYPALVLSGFKPATVLKGLFKNSSGGSYLRKGLIITQYTASIVLIAGTIIVFQQVNYMRNQQLGVNINQTLVLEGASSVQDSLYRTIFQPFKNELNQMPDVESVTASTSIMGKEIYWTNSAKRLASDSRGMVTLFNIGIDYDFLPSYDLKLVAGRNFSRDQSTDGDGILLNEAAARLLGFNDLSQALNERIISAGDTVSVLGIVDNYHHQGFQKAVDPMVFRLTPNTRNAYSIKIGTSNVSGTIAAIEKKWQQFFPNDPFKYYFLDAFFNQQYQSDQKFGEIFGIFAFLAILIASFGLLGLSAFNVLQRTKEIGIRKVLGASVQHVLFILCKDFIVLVSLAIVLSVPLIWWIMSHWLEDFAYHISIRWWVIVVAAAMALFIAIATVSIQSMRAALVAPVDSLRSE
ncbi:MAG: FtsX-like permease family protein [Saprospiraceae bacterium]